MKHKSLIFTAAMLVLLALLSFFVVNAEDASVTSVEIISMKGDVVVGASAGWVNYGNPVADKIILVTPRDSIAISIFGKVHLYKAEPRTPMCLDIPAFDLNKLGATEQPGKIVVMDPTAPAYLGEALGEWDFATGLLGKTAESGLTADCAVPNFEDAPAVYVGYYNKQVALYTFGPYVIVPNFLNYVSIGATARIIAFGPDSKPVFDLLKAKPTGDADYKACIPSMAGMTLATFDAAYPIPAFHSYLMDANNAAMPAAMPASNCPAVTAPLFPMATPADSADATPEATPTS